MLKPALRERLLGALVFLCLGLIFYPAIFDTRDEFIVDRQTQIPTQLIRVEPLALEEPVVPDQVSSPPPTAAEIFVPSEEVTVTPGEPPSSILDESGIPNSWVLQVGSFSNQDNAREEEQKLLDTGFRAYTRRAQSEDGSARFRVLVGPYLDRSIALADLNAMVRSGYDAPLLMEFSP